MDNDQIKKAEPVFTHPSQTVPLKSNQKAPEQSLPPQFVVPPEPKTPWGKAMRSFSEIKNNLVIPQKIRIWGPRIAVVVISLTLIIALLPFVTKLVSNFLPQATPTPQPQATEEPTSYQPSPYANDEVVLAIEEELNQIEQELKIITFREDTLSLPNLDWSVSF